MNVVDNLTVEKATQALDKVRAEYETDNSRLAIITPDRYEEICDIMAHHFAPDEPLSRGFGVTWNKEFEASVLENLKCNVSFCMISKDTSEIMGVQVIGIVKSCDTPPDLALAELQNEEWRSSLNFFTRRDSEVDFFGRFGVGEAVYFFGLAINRKYRRMGLGGRMVAAAVAMSRELGFQVIRTEGTSNYSQRILEKQGFETLLTMPYDSYMYKGRPIKEGTGEHTMAKIYGLRL